MDANGRRPWRNLTRLAGWARGLLAAQAALAGILAVATIGFGPLFDEEGGSRVWATVAPLTILLFLVAGIVVLRWIYLANANAHALGAQGMGSSPALAVGCYFIPIANLFLPCQSMREIWKASSAPRDWEIAPASPVIIWWWLCWLFSGFAGAISTRLDMMEGAPEMEHADWLLSIASNLLTVGASLLLIVIIRRITIIQQEAHESR